jgi:hypothetical protein
MLLANCSIYTWLFSWEKGRNHSLRPMAFLYLLLSYSPDLRATSPLQFCCVTNPTRDQHITSVQDATSWQVVTQWNKPPRTNGNHYIALVYYRLTAVGLKVVQALPTTPSDIQPSATTSFAVRSLHARNALIRPIFIATSRITVTTKVTWRY